MKTEEINEEELLAFILALKTKFGLDFTHYENSKLKRALLRIFDNLGIDSIYELWIKILEESKSNEKSKTTLVTVNKLLSLSLH